MQRAPALPLLPGFNFDTNLGRTNFHRQQQFEKIDDGVYYLSEKPDKSHTCYSIDPPGELQKQPAWLTFDRQRLMFKAYFKQSLHRGRNAPCQMRFVNISFFLEDGTMKISEPPVDNSGLEQGVLVRRQRIPKSDIVKYRYHDILDLNIGKELEIFGVVYKIVDCDKFTRHFLNHLGIAVPDSLPLPKDIFTEQSQCEQFSKKPHEKVDTRGSFLKYDKKVLRFYGFWDDTHNLYGVIHDLEIYYYLADDTMEIKEIIPPNSGKDSPSILVKRMKIPKFFSGLEPVGAKAPFTILNVMGENTLHSHYLIDALNTGKFSTEYYKDSDLGIGIEINVFGRRVVITDMDEFTKNFYRRKYGLEDFKPLVRPRMKSENGEKVEKYIPPYNGYGTYEDSLGNCFSVIPKPPKVDFVKFFYYDKKGLNSHVLRFRARMISDNPNDAERQFIIRIFLMDDTISIFELTKRNSGFKRCLFQKRMPVMLPGEDIFISRKPLYFKPEDFYVGQCVNLNGFVFEILSADSYALRYMELHSDKFPKANIKLIMEKVRECLKPVYREFLQQYTSEKSDHDFQVLQYEQLREAMRKYVKSLEEHEIITIARYYSAHVDKELCTREYVRSLVHTELLRSLWNNLDRLEEDIHHWDRERTGFLPRDTMYTILRGARIPLDVEIINSILDHLKTNEEDKLDYNDLLRFMNVKIDPLPAALPVNIKTALWWRSEKEPECGAGIDWCAFIKDLNIEDEGVLLNQTQETD